MPPITIAEHEIKPGERKRLQLQISRLPSDHWVSMPVEVVHGQKPGPTIWLSGAIHGDEIIGVEIIRRVLRRIDENKLRGCLIGVPIVNVFGFVDQTRYLPDGRDLNRSFPGSMTGSLASRLANKFMTEIVNHCQYGIDFHSGSNHRTNLPQIRTNLEEPESSRCAQMFGAPVIVDAKNRDGSLRQAAVARGICCLLYEAGEPMRFDQQSIKIGETGVFSVLAGIGMYGNPKKNRTQSRVARKSVWLRSRKGGILRLRVGLGDYVAVGDTIGEVADAFGYEASRITSRQQGIVIGLTNNPIVYQGDAVVHIADIGDQESSNEAI